MTSEHVSELLSAFIDGELTDTQSAQVEAHLEHCPQCKQELEGLRNTVGLVRSLPELELPEAFRAELRQKLLLESAAEKPRVGEARSRSTSSRSIWSRVRSASRGSWIGVAAAAVLIVALVATAGTGLLSPDDLLSNLAGSQQRAQEDAGAGPSATEGALPGVTSKGASPEAMPPVTGEAEEPAGDTAQPQYSSSDETSVLGTASFERKIIRTGEFDVQVEDTSKAYQQVVVMAETMGGFVQESTQQADGERLRAYLIIRVPADGFRRAVEELTALGKVENQHLSGQDVTEEYVDLESRLRTLQAKESRLIDILGQAQSVDEILQVERELWSVRGQVEQVQGRMRYLTNLTSMSTIRVSLYEPRPVPPDQEPDTLFDQLIKALTDSIKYLGYYVSRLLVAVTWLLPYAAVGLAIWWLVRMFLRRRTE